MMRATQGYPLSFESLGTKIHMPQRPFTNREAAKVRKQHCCNQNELMKEQ